MTFNMREVVDSSEWDQLVLSLPHPHLLQSWLWGEIKSSFGWSPTRFVWEGADGGPQAAAQVLLRALPGPMPLSVLYCPKGPLLAWEDEGLRLTVLGDLEGLASDPGVVQCKVDPDLPLGFGLPGQDGHKTHPTGLATQGALNSRGWKPSGENVQFANTMLLDLRPSEDDLLANMKQKTRYNIRLAGRKGVNIRRGTNQDIDLLVGMYAETSMRDGFVIRGPDYYAEVWGRFIEAGAAQPLIAEVEGEAVAALIVYAFGPTAWYMYGMSRELHREKMPNYLLQWEAIRWARSCGCTDYDLWGAPDTFDESDPMWGVYRFKDGFGARVMRTLGAWDYTARPRLYWAYNAVLPRLLSVMRYRGSRQTAELLD